MRIGWIGHHVEGISALRGVLESGYRLECVITLNSEGRERRSGTVDYSPLCSTYGVPLYQVSNINDDYSLNLLERLSLDLAFVIGWNQIVRAEALKLTRIGMIGAHASLLPHNRGRAPINWSLINGEVSTGNSLIWLAEGVDTGDIIDQRTIPVTRYDTCSTLYEQVAEANRDMILGVLPALLAGRHPGVPQQHNGEKLLPARKPEDGVLDWSLTNVRVYDFVRALTKPYPGAFSWLGGKRWRIWQCSLLPDIGSIDAVPGQVLGGMHSPVADACGQVVACGKGAVALLHLETDDGQTLKGSNLSDQPWTGEIWTNEQ